MHAFRGSIWDSAILLQMDYILPVSYLTCSALLKRYCFSHTRPNNKYISKVNKTLFLTQINYGDKNTFFQLQNNFFLNKNYNSNKKWTKIYYNVHLCIAEPNLEVLPLGYFVKGLSLLSDVLSDDKNYCNKKKSNTCN